MSEDDDEMKRDLECLRLASDFMRLSRDTLNAELRVHCVRLAEYWSDQANSDPVEDATSPKDMDK
jgi:hypothetical protein